MTKKISKAEAWRNFAKRVAAQGTTVVGLDGCKCADCVERRAKGDIRPPQIYPAKLKEEEE